MSTGGERWGEAARALGRFAWPLAFVAVAAMAFLHFDRAPAPASEVRVEHEGPTVIRDLRALAKLETTTLHVEKVIDVRDHQAHLDGLIEAEDAMLFVATGEVVLGVDLAKLGERDARFDEATRTAYVDLPPVEVFSTRFDEMHSYVASRSTDLLAKRNEGLESSARRRAQAAFEAAGRDPHAIERAKAQAEREIRALASAWGAKDVVVTWKPAGPPGPSAGAPAGEAPLR